MQIVVLGLNHVTAPIEVREKINFTVSRQKSALETLTTDGFFKESVILQTCNRSEIYAVVPTLEQAEERLVKFLESFHSLERGSLNSHLYFYEGSRAVQHAFRVAASLDAMVVGETQILGQVKDAYLLALELEKTDLLLNKLFRQAIQVGKRVRTETNLGALPVSIGYAAVELAVKIFGGLDQRSTMIIGAGETAELVLRSLVKRGVKVVLVTNRTQERAVELSKRLGGQVVPFAAMMDALTDVDIVISSTAAPHYVMSSEQLSELVHKRKNKPLFLVDIAVPRDIPPDADKLENVFLYNIDDLKRVVEQNMQQRTEEVEAAEKIVLSGVASFSSWLNGLEATPTIVSFRKKLESIRDSEVERLFSKVKTLDDDQKREIEKFSESLLNKVLRPPTVNLRKSASEKKGLELMSSLRILFDLDKKQGDSPG
ncbi:MAG: glutamyl-tRNA reductase [Candidatus Eiseniibacteriota bacterium]|nr:MAG: glutamyl-tRNA reductase [Candidatus Eisenbacteria bacterium]